MAEGHVVRILTVNAGSTSLKVERYDLDPRDVPPIAQPPMPADRREPDHDDARAGLRDAIGTGVDRVVHRFVQLPAGEARAIFRLDDATIGRIRAVALDDPLHDAAALRAFDDVASLAPHAAQFGASDSAFHRTMPAAASTYALPRDLIARFPRNGYHGLSHEYAAARGCALAGLDPTTSRVITAHLGGGSSLCAIAGGRSIDTTMGWSPLEGLPMATRSGSIDPGVLASLVRSGVSGDELLEMLQKKSGLLGMSGSTGDVRALLAAAASEADDASAARLALDVLAWRTRAALGAMAAVLGGVDLVVFTGGIGEHAAPVRSAILENGLGYGIVLDAQRNDASREGRLDCDESKLPVVLVAAREGWQLARLAATA